MSDGKRVKWLDSADLPSHVHKTLDGKTTVCGHDFLKDQGGYKWKVIQGGTRRKGKSLWCVTCFKDGKKALPWLEIK